MKSRLTELGKDIRDALGDGPDEERTLAQRRAIIESAPERPTRGNWWRFAWVGAPVAGLAVVVVAVVVLLRSDAPHQPPAPECATANGLQVTKGQWLSAGDEPEVLRFAEGSEVTLTRASRMRLEEIDRERVVLSLESGTVRSSIRPGPERAWTVRAGPYRVRVVGTEFDVTWTPGEERLSVVVNSGRVAVEGGAIDAVRVSAGERLAARGPRFTLSPSDAPDDGDAVDSTTGGGNAAPPAPRNAQDEDATRSAPEPRGGDSERDRGAGEDGAPSWRQLARRGDWARAAAAADGVGLEALAARLGAWDLLLLGDAYRLSGRSRPAREVLLTLRKRFAEHEASSAAAFRLGRIASDRGERHREAARWYRTVLSEAPESSLAPDARGRLMEALSQAGDRAGAQRVAKEYMRKHPDGPYQRLARSLVAADGESE